PDPAADSGRDQEVGHLDGGRGRRPARASGPVIVVVPSPAPRRLAGIRSPMARAVSIRIIVGRHESPRVIAGGDSCLPTLASQVSRRSGAQSFFFVLNTSRYGTADRPSASLKLPKLSLFNQIA